MRSEPMEPKDARRDRAAGTAAARCDRCGLICALALGALLWGCDSDPSPNAAPSSAVTEAEERAEAEPRPRHGGALVRLGEHLGELVVHASGEIHFHVRSEEDLSEAGVTVTLPDEEGEAHAVALEWRDETQGFVGQLEPAVATPGPDGSPAEVLLVRHGRRWRGRARIERLLPLAEHEGSVLAVGEHVVEVVVEPDGRAHLYVLDAPRQQLDLELTLSLAGQDERLHPLTLGWDPAAGHYTGRIEGLTPRPGPIEIILERGERQHLGRGTLLEVGLRAPDGVPPSGVPEDFQLEMPGLGSDLPDVIAVPPPQQ